MQAFMKLQGTKLWITQIFQDELLLVQKFMPITVLHLQLSQLWL